MPSTISSSEKLDAQVHMSTSSSPGGRKHHTSTAPTHTPTKTTTPHSSPTKRPTTRPTSPAKHAITYDLGSSRPSSRAASPVKTPSRPNSPAKHAITYDLGSSRPSSRAGTPTSRPGSPNKRHAVKDATLEMGEGGFVFKARLGEGRIDPGLGRKKGGEVAGSPMKLVVEEVGVVGGNGQVKMSPTKAGSREGTPKKKSPVKVGGRLPSSPMGEGGNGKLQAKEGTTDSSVRSAVASARKVRTVERSRQNSGVSGTNKSTDTRSPGKLSTTKAPISAQNWTMTTSRGKAALTKSGSTPLSTERHKQTMKSSLPSAFFSPQVKKPVQRGARDIGDLMARMQVRGQPHTPKFNETPYDQDTETTAPSAVCPASTSPRSRPLSTSSPKRISEGDTSACSSQHIQQIKGTSPAVRSAISYDMDALKQTLQHSFGPEYFAASPTASSPGTPSLPSERAHLRRLDTAASTPVRKPLTLPGLRSRMTLMQRVNGTPVSPKRYPPPSPYLKARPSLASPAKHLTPQAAFFDRLSTPKRPLVDRPIYHPRSPYCEEQVEVEKETDSRQQEDTMAGAETIGRMEGEWGSAETAQGEATNQDQSPSHTPPGSPPSSSHPLIVSKYNSYPSTPSKRLPNPKVIAARGALHTPSRQVSSELDRAIDAHIEDSARKGRVFSPGGQRYRELLERRGGRGRRGD